MNTLELAARAMQATGDRNFCNFTAYDDAVCLELGRHRGAVTSYWSPHIDLGDCAWMETVLGIDIQWGESEVVARKGRVLAKEAYGDHAGDRICARRRAALHVAAGLGKSAP